MSKTLPAGLLSHYAGDTTVCQIVKVTRTDSEVAGFTSWDHPVEVDGVTYEPGFDPSALSSTDTLAVDNLELTVLADDDDQLREDLLAGRWDGAFFEISEINAESPSDGVNTLKRGWLGEVRFERGRFVVEFRSLAQLLQQPQGIATTKTCRARLGDAACGVDLGPWTVTSTITAVASTREITDNTRAEAEDYFAEGVLTFTDGLNAGISRKVRSFASGIFTLSLPFPFTVEAGDAYTAVAGCRKRREDCRDKFANILNFQGEPHLPGVDALARPAQADDEEAPPAEGSDGGWVSGNEP